MVEQMEEPPTGTQADFINELNFSEVDPNDPLTKATLEEAKPEEWVDILGSGQLKKKTITEGEPNTRPQRSDLCTISYTAKLDDGTVVEEEENLLFQIGDMELIQGLDLTLALMNVGEVAEIEVASRFAYGSIGKEPSIPPDSTLHYKITLIDVKQEDEIETMKFQQRKETGNKKRERGNYWFKRNEPTIAIQCYRRALEYLSPPEEADIADTWKDSDLQGLLEDRMVVYNNLAMAQIKAEAYDVALESVENVLRCQPNNDKALFRKGKILHIKGEHTAAYNTLMQALKINPQDKKIMQELEIIKQKSKRDAQTEKNLYRKMLGTKQSKGEASGNKKEMKKGSSTLAWSLVGGTAIAVVGLFAYRLIS